MAKQAKKKTGAKNKAAGAKKSAGGKKTAAAKTSGAKKPPAKKPAKKLAKAAKKVAALKKPTGKTNARAAAKPAKAPSTKAQRATPPRKARPATAQPISHDDVNERADDAVANAGAPTGPQAAPADAAIDEAWSDTDAASGDDDTTDQSASA